jgi:hypothetical protein
LNYQVELIVEKDYLKGTVSGRQTFIDNENLVLMLLEKCVELRLNKVLLDMTGMVGQPGTFSDFQLANFAVEKGLPEIKKVALVAAPENFKHTQFFETVSSNRGLNVRAFVDMDEALAWVNEG